MRLWKVMSPSYRILATLLLASTAAAQTTPRVRSARPLIVDRVDETRRLTLRGNTRPEANSANDAGAAPSTMAMEHMLLVMQQGSAQAQSLTQTIDQLHDPQSPSFHKWLTAEQFGQTYGAAQQD